MNAAATGGGAIYQTDDADASVVFVTVVGNTASFGAGLYKDAERQLMDDGGVIIPTFVSVVAAVRKNCEGFVPHIESRVLFQNVTCK